MKEKYISPKWKIIEYDVEDIITTSGILDTFTGETANEDAGWTGLY